MENPTGRRIQLLTLQNTSGGGVAESDSLNWPVIFGQPEAIQKRASRRSTVISSKATYGQRGREGITSVGRIRWRAFDKTVRRKPLAVAADARRYGNSIDFGGVQDRCPVKLSPSFSLANLIPWDRPGTARASTSRSTQSTRRKWNFACSTVSGRETSRLGDGMERPLHMIYPVERASEVSAWQAARVGDWEACSLTRRPRWDDEGWLPERRSVTRGNLTPSEYATWARLWPFG